MLTVVGERDRVGQSNDNGNGTEYENLILKIRRITYSNVNQVI